MTLLADIREAPPVEPGQNLATVSNRVSDIALRMPTPRWWWAGFGASFLLFIILCIAAGNLFVSGIGIWGVNIPVAWGFALANYVWWIGVASGGTIISALFFITRSEWRTAVNRVAETMTLFAAAAAGLMPIFHLGRQGLFYWLFPYPNVMGIWPQFRSPLLWDFFALLCYIIASILFWYIGLLPDWAALRDRAPTRWQQVFYGTLACGWTGAARHWKRFRVVYGIMCAFMAPMVMSVHSIVGLDFAGGLTPGWHSTQFPPYFVFGAVYSGFATVLFLVLPIRRLYRLEAFITEYHINALAKMMLATGLMLTYSYALEAFMPYYSGNPYDVKQIRNDFFDLYALQYWGKILFNVVIPQLLWFPRLRLNEPLLFLVSVGIIFGMWLERYVIVVSSLYQDFMPSAWYFFAGSLWDWLTLAGSIGLFLTGIFIFLRLVPIIAMFEMRELVHREEGAG
ncbi:MAG TPA: NrfD/PsrC family molybdoenzyme membrane anchor subunit [Stellaceae bacterium]|nr:NrfD/PsrC family molybdoenzyme membrane anchor subunit [Stellaceae bacterium]